MAESLSDSSVPKNYSRQKLELWIRSTGMYAKHFVNPCSSFGVIFLSNLGYAEKTLSAQKLWHKKFEIS